jgi:hypothetical protein
MKTQTPVLANAPTTSLKIVHSYLIETSEDDLPVTQKNSRAFTKTSPFKSLYVLHPSIQDEKNWDSTWFNNYE